MTTNKEHEPVAWMIWTHGPVLVFLNKNEADLELDRLNREHPSGFEHRKIRPLVFGDTTPPQRTWVGLTDDERRACMQSPFITENYRSIEALLKEKNT